ncbi:acyltransferase [Cryobacterium sp. MLB-32]|uniref:acyltransferase family protein n=1 Tax=Cryobacterium sp. MLB-32 TaxID=1529318 RepID=UPI00068DDEE4|nr:acyltransferase [Cryobacterium sp. MLB-32]
MGAVDGALRRGDHEPLGSITSLFLINSFSPDGSVYVAVNPPSWTLCSELLFYMLFPVIITLLRRIPANWLWTSASVMVLCMVGVQLITLYLIPATPASALTPISETQFWFGYIFPVTRLFEFVLGSILALVVLSGKWIPMKMYQALLLCLAGYGVALVVPFVFSFVAAMVIPLSALICTSATEDMRGGNRFLRSAVMQWLGNISFGFYLCQGVVIFFGRILMGNATYSTPIAFLVVGGFFVAAILGGWALYALVEKPAMARWARPRRSKTTEGRQPALVT